MMYQGWKAQATREGEPERMVTKQVSLLSKKRAGWLDAMLGSGSSKTVQEAFPTRRVESLRPAAPVLRVQALRSNDPPAPAAAKGKGVIRYGLLALAVVGIAAKTKPWAGWTGPAEAPARIVIVPAPAKADASDILHDAKGSAVALWHAPSGQWYFVNAIGQLRRAGNSEAAERIDLAQLSGAKLLAPEAGVLRLDIQEGLMSEALPLSSQIAAEVQSVSFEGGEVRLLTQGGTTARLGSEGFKEKEARLAVVLADLAARKKRAASVDLRFKDSAVVRLASR